MIAGLLDLGGGLALRWFRRNLTIFATISPLIFMDF